MIINNKNYQVGNKAMASVLLLYYHLLDEGGITDGQTVYIDYEDFNGYDFLGVELKEESNESLDINETLIREGAIIYLLCDLNDFICDYNEDYLSQPITKKIITALKEHKDTPIQEVTNLLKTISVPESELNYVNYNDVLQSIYKKYVYGFFVKKLSQ